MKSVIILAIVLFFVSCRFQSDKNDKNEVFSKALDATVKEGIDIAFGRPWENSKDIEELCGDFDDVRKEIDKAWEDEWAQQSSEKSESNSSNDSQESSNNESDDNSIDDFLSSNDFKKRKTDTNTSKKNLENLSKEIKVCLFKLMKDQKNTFVNLRKEYINYKNLIKEGKNFKNSPKKAHISKLDEIDPNRKFRNEVVKCFVPKKCRKEKSKRRHNKKRN